MYNIGIRLISNDHEVGKEARMHTSFNTVNYRASYWPKNLTLR
jgi:hypothetical protein